MMVKRDLGDADDFSREAQGRQHGILREVLSYIMHNKKWWLTPIILVLLLVGLLVVAGGTALAPFIYTLF